MVNSKQQMLSSAIQLRELLSSIEGILEGYEGVSGNKNYVKYCYNKSKECHTIDDGLSGMVQDTYAVDLNMRRGINIATLVHYLEKMFKLLDDIDTASDIFKPKWCKITRVVSNLQQLRWTYCTVNKLTDGESILNMNGECYRKEDRVILSILNK